MKRLLILLPFLLVAVPGWGQTPPTTLSCWSDPRIPSILSLGKDHPPDAHAKLKAIADEAQGSEGREMAKVMLLHWDENDGSYQYERPQHVDRFVLSMDEKRKVLPPRIQQTILAFDVLVDEQGCPAKVDVVRGGDYPAFLELVLGKVKKLRYIPKKDGNRYVAAKISSMLNQEVN